MRKILRKINMFAKHEIVCMLSLLASLIYAVYYIDIQDPLKYSLSEIGRSNWMLFIVWCILSGVALLLNVNKLYERTRHTNFNQRLPKICLYSGLGFLVLTFLNMSKEPMFWYYIHVVTAILFAVLTFYSIISCLIYMAKRQKPYLYLTAIVLIIVFIDIVFLIIYKQMALFESIPLILCYIVLFFTNFTQTFNPIVIKS